MHALRSSLIFKKKRCFLVFYILQDILNEIMTALAKTHASSTLSHLLFTPLLITPRGL